MKSIEIVRFADGTYGARRDALYYGYSPWWNDWDWTFSRGTCSRWRFKWQLRLHFWWQHRLERMQEDQTTIVSSEPFDIP